jgi:hypothetical protein
VGLGYLASYLRANGVEATIWNLGIERTYSELRDQMRRVFASRSFELVGISYKWFHHVARSLLLGAIVREVAPGVPIVFGGNSASQFWEDLISYDFVDYVVLGDGEEPLLRICQRDPNPPNCLVRTKEGFRRTPRSYLQTGAAEESVRYVELDSLFISKRDLFSYEPQLIGGKGCKMDCIFCAGGRPNQLREFGRGSPVVRPTSDVRNDVAQLLPNNMQLVLDFTTVRLDVEKYLREIFDPFDLSKKAIRLVSWEIPDERLLGYLSGKFAMVHALIDAACFSERQRLFLAQRGMVKANLTDEQIFRFLDDCERYDNVWSGLYSVFGLPYMMEQDLVAETAFLERLLRYPSFLHMAANTLLEAQPGSRATELADEMGMSTPVRTFLDYLRYFEEYRGLRDLRVTYQDLDFDRQVVARVEAHKLALRDRGSAKAIPHYAIPAQGFALAAGLRLVKEHQLRWVVPRKDWNGPFDRKGVGANEPMFLYKNILNHIQSFDPESLPFRIEGGPRGADTVADALLQAFESPMTVAEAYRASARPHGIGQEAYLGFLAQAADKWLLRRV